MKRDLPRKHKEEWNVFQEAVSTTAAQVASWEDLIGYVDGNLRYVRVESRMDAFYDDAVDKKRKLLRDFNELVDLRLGKGCFFLTFRGSSSSRRVDTFLDTFHR